MNSETAYTRSVQIQTRQNPSTEKGCRNMQVLVLTDECSACRVVLSKGEKAGKGCG